MQVMHAYASMWMLMQVMCMLKCMFNMLCKLWECLYASSTCYARYVYDNMQIHMQYVMQVMCDNMQVWVKYSWVNICSCMQVDILLTHDKVIC